jgi:hypothetical protein
MAFGPLGVKKSCIYVVGACALVLRFNLGKIMVNSNGHKFNE